MQLIRIFDGSFGGQTLYKNPEFVNPNKVLFLGLPLVFAHTPHLLLPDSFGRMLPKSVPGNTTSGCRTSNKRRIGTPSCTRICHATAETTSSMPKRNTTYLCPNHLLCVSSPTTSKECTARRDISGGFIVGSGRRVVQECVIVHTTVTQTFVVGPVFTLTGLRDTMLVSLLRGKIYLTLLQYTTHWHRLHCKGLRRVLLHIQQR